MVANKTSGRGKRNEYSNTPSKTKRERPLGRHSITNVAYFGTHNDLHDVKIEMMAEMNIHHRNYTVCIRKDCFFQRQIFHSIIFRMCHG
jgi:hypothetical protein